MASKRMINLKLIDTDLFLEMPVSARLLYYEYCMRADDDGFVDAPLKIIKMIGVSNDDYKILVTKQFIIPFETRVCVVKHWLLHNTIRGDRYHPTIHIYERNMLEITNSKTYEIKGYSDDGNQMATTWQPNGNPDKISNNSNNIYIQEETINPIFEIIEKEFGRLLSPLEIEIINTWDYPLDVLKLAIQEASTSGNFNIKYIDKIIYNWQKKNIKSVADAKKSIADFRELKEKKKRGNGLPDISETGASYYKKL